MVEEIKFDDLKRYSFVFRFYVWLKRVRMILFRLIFLGIVGIIVFVLLFKDSVNFEGEGSFSGTLTLNPIFWLFVWFVWNYILLMSMQMAWYKFANANGFELQKHGVPHEKTKVPSFMGKWTRWQLYPILGKFNGLHFGFFTRLYKEGGVLRWRERKMDTVLWYNLPKYAPHIVIDSRYNENARRSNLGKSYDKSQLLHFEGPIGHKYNVYTAKGNEELVLQLFTPDVLEVFFHYLPQVDIEIKNKTVWFVWRYGILNDRLAKEMFVGSQIFMEEFLKQLNQADFTELETMAVLK
jgi:hypothetical protein